MSNNFTVEPMSQNEIVDYSISFINVTPSGETIESATITHEPPFDMTPLTPTPTVAHPSVSFEVGPLTELGLHRFRVLATFTNGAKSEIRLNIPVEW